MLEVIGRSDDDPPIFALRVAGRDAAREVSRWLTQNADVTQIRVFAESADDLSPRDVEALIDQHSVEIEVAEFQGEPVHG